MCIISSLWCIQRSHPREVIDFADKDFVSLDENTLVAEAARIMYERDICSVIVTRNDSERLLKQSVGIITARDFLHRAVVAQSKSHLNWH
jgi:predicted transcriptional regulator